MRMDKSCCWKGDFLDLSRGKVTILVGRVRLVPVNTAGYRTLRVAGGVTFRCGGAGKSVF